MDDNSPMIAPPSPSRGWELMKRNLLILLLMLVCSHTAAARIYKWTDEDGQVHFSETPPPSQEQDDAEVEEVKLGGSQYGAMAPEQRKGHWYCGKRRLSFTASEPVIELSNLKNNMSHWREQKQDATHRYQEVRTQVAAHKLKYPRSKGQEKRLKGALNRLQEITCVVGWAENRIRELSGIGEAYVSEYADLQRQLDRLEAAKLRECGSPGNLRGEQAAEFRRCQNKFKSKIDPLQKQLRYRRSLAESIDQ